MNQSSTRRSKKFSDAKQALFTLLREGQNYNVHYITEKAEQHYVFLVQISCNTFVNITSNNASKKILRKYIIMLHYVLHILNEKL